MKEITTSSTRSPGFVRGTAGAGVLLAAWLLLGASPAGAQDICADPVDVPEEMFELYAGFFGGSFALSEEACEKLVKGGVAACHKAVSGSVQCWSSVIGSLGKGAKVACSELTGVERENCLAEYGEELDDADSETEMLGDQAHAVCDEDFVDALFGTCLGLVEE